MPNPPIIWSKDMDQVLLDEWPTTTPRKEIADRIGVGLNTAQRRAKALGLMRPRGGWREPQLAEKRSEVDERDARVVELQSQGLTVSQVMERLGFRSRGSVHRAAARAKEKTGKQAG